MVSHTKVHGSGNLVLTISGEVPTLPNPLSLLKGSNGWRRTDLAEGEQATNKADNLFFIRIGNVIRSMTIGYQKPVNSYFPSGW